MTVETVEMSADELEQLRADLASARAEVRRLRASTNDGEVADKLHRAQSEIDQLNRAVTALAGERDTARAEGQELGNELAEVREMAKNVYDTCKTIEGERDDLLDAGRRLKQQLADAEAALVEANGARRLSSAEHLHQRIAAAALVIARFSGWRYCPVCRDLREPSGARHVCGPLIPVDVIVARRPNPPTTEEQP